VFIKLSNVLILQNRPFIKTLIGCFYGGYGIKRHVQQYFSYIVAVNFALSMTKKKNILTLVLSEKSIKTANQRFNEWTIL
jgi:hypothetical protein